MGRTFLDRLLKPKEPPLGALWNRIVALAREPEFYTRFAVPDTIDGRFDMLALVTALVMVRLESDDRRAELAQLTERFVDDMDGSLRQMGIGDQVVGKQVGRMLGALGGRLGAYHGALDAADPAATLAAALERNVYRGDDRLLAAPDLAGRALALHRRLGSTALADVLEGRF
jgi:cytochrome b pre-mRNA-processing protein 3